MAAPGYPNEAVGQTKAYGHSSDKVVTIIEPPKGFGFRRLREVWAYRDLMYFLVRRDITIRYKQAALGVLWVVLQPVLLAVIFSVFLGKLASVPSQGGVPYPIFVLSGMTLWLFFATALSRISDSTVSSSDLISKVYFPRLILPLSAALQQAVDFMLATVVVIGAMVLYGVTPALTCLLVPIICVLVLVVTLALGIWLSALHARYRDIQIIVPFLIQAGLFVTPIAYPITLVPADVRWIYALNPVVGVVEIYRWALIPHYAFPGPLLLLPLGVGVLLLIGGMIYFNRVECDFADVI